MKHGDTGLLKEMLRELSHVGAEESKDSAGVRNVADFLVRRDNEQQSALTCFLLVVYQPVLFYSPPPPPRTAQPHTSANAHALCSERLLKC